MNKIIKRSICFAIVAVLIIVAIVGNFVLSSNALLLHGFFAGNTTNYEGEEVENAMKLADETVRDMAADSMVLLKNEKETLPLSETDRKVNLFGWNSTDAGFLLEGGGSGGIDAYADKKVTLGAAFEAEGFQYNETLMEAYEAYSTYDADKNYGANSILINPPASFYTTELLGSCKEFSDIAIITLSRWGEENGGEIPLYQPKSGDGVSNDSSRMFLELSTEEEALIDLVCDNFNTVIVLINSGNVMELGFLEDERIDAAIFVGQPGQSGAVAIPRILKGDVTPSGKTADTYAYDAQTNSPSWANALYRGTGNIHYAEGIYVGYRWYETADVEGFFDDVNNEYGSGYEGVVQYPFGYGLSYTDFEWEVTEIPDPQTEIEEDSEFTVKVRVTNVGEHSGKDVVELYYTPPYYTGEIEKAHMNLLAFGKTEELQPGQSQELTLTFSAYDMASYDDYDKNNNNFSGYELDAGDYVIKLMDDVHTAADCENQSVTLVVKDNIKIRRDPVTNTFVKNQFTGENAYASVPIDGSTVHSEIEYMTRADFEGTFPTAKTSNPNNSSAVNEASNYIYRDYGDVEKPTQGQSGDLRLVTKADGSYASYAELEGSASAELAYNDELLAELSDYESDKWDDLLNQLSEQDIKDLIGKGGYNIWAIESIGMPKRTSRDGPAGFNLDTATSSGNALWTAYPTASLIGCSWSHKTAYNFGRAQAAEGQSTNVTGWCAPGINIHRTPYTSRNYEYFSEDSVITGEIAAEIIRGAKQGGLHCYMKHWCASEAGDNPTNWNTWLTEQSLREIYMKPFEIATKEGGANAIMSAFSRVGAVWSGANYAMNVTILRDEWGFRGSMVTDWFLDYMAYDKAVLGGNDTFLDVNQNSANLDLSDPTLAYASRVAAKNILYTFVDTYITSKDYIENGDPNDPYKVTIDIKVDSTPYSPLFTTLWVLADVVLAAGVVVCLIIAFKKPKKEKVAKE